MENLGQAAAIIANRVRDPNFNGTTEQQTIALISYSQQVVNGILGDLVTSQALTIQPRTLIYSMSGFVPGSIDVLAVQDASGRDLDPLGLQDLQWLDMRWPVAVADSPRGYTQVGGDLLIIYPAVKTPQILTVKFSQFIAPVTGPADSTSLPPEDDSAINDLAETLILLKNRDLLAVKAAMERFAGRIKQLQTEKR